MSLLKVSRVFSDYNSMGIIKYLIIFDLPNFFSWPLSLRTPSLVPEVSIFICGTKGWILIGFLQWSWR